MQTQRSTAVDVGRGNARHSPEALALDARRAAGGLGLTMPDVRRVLETDEATAAAIVMGCARIAPGTDLADRTLLLVRLHRALGDVHGSLDRMDRWLDATEPSLGERPRTLMRSPEGLERVVEHVERGCKDCLW